MLDVIHRESTDSLGGWVFDCPALPGIHGGARTFSESVATAEHAARQQLSREATHPIDHEAAVRLLRHLPAGGSRPHDRGRRPGSAG